MALTKTNIMLRYAMGGVILLGLGISVYALIIEVYKDADPNYKPVCDINPTISCSKALMSDWGKGFGFVSQFFGDNHWLNQRNPVFGIIFYILLFILVNFNSLTAARITLWLVVLANIGTIILAYIMYAYIKSLCLVCVSLYVVNFALLPLSMKRISVLKQLARKKKD